MVLEIPIEIHRLEYRRIKARQEHIVNDKEFRILVVFERLDDAIALLGVRVELLDEVGVVFSLSV